MNSFTEGTWFRPTNYLTTLIFHTQEFLSLDCPSVDTVTSVTGRSPKKKTQLCFYPPLSTTTSYPKISKPPPPPTNFHSTRVSWEEICQVQIFIRRFKSIRSPKDLLSHRQLASCTRGCFYSLCPQQPARDFHHASEGL